jgi:hypothetical protein
MTEKLKVVFRPVALWLNISKLDRTMLILPPSLNRIVRKIKTRKCSFSLADCESSRSGSPIPPLMSNHSEETLKSDECPLNGTPHF